MSNNFTFNDYPEFIEHDNRRLRPIGGVHVEILDSKIPALLPQNICKNASVLDVGCALGQVGHYALTHGAAVYTGTDNQSGFIDPAKQIFSKYWETAKYDLQCVDAEKFIDGCIKNGKTFDVVVAASVLVCFINPFSIIEKLTKITNKYLIIEHQYPKKMINETDMIIEMSEETVSSAIKPGYNYGLGHRMSPNALRTILKNHNFIDDVGLIYPVGLREDEKRIYVESTSKIMNQSEATYVKNLPAKFIIRFKKSSNTEKIISCSESSIIDNKFSQWAGRKYVPPKTEIEKWAFDSKVANRFQSEAQNHIPSYDFVITKCCDELKKFTLGSRVLDVGSALGYSVSKFYNLGYDAFGLEASDDMFNSSLLKSRIFVGNSLQHPAIQEKQPWSMIVINWTAHFLNQQDRKALLLDAYHLLEPGGILILTDKMTFSDEERANYYSWKMSNGVSIDEILKKEQALVGTLIPLPIEWYSQSLTDVGFNEQKVIHTHFMFNTFYCVK